MKFVKIFAISLGVLFLVVYIVAFTPPGNGLVAPILQKKIRQASGLEVVLERFSLSMSDFAITMRITPKNVVRVQGEYSIFSRSFSLDYDISFSALQELRTIAKAPIRGKFFTNGNVSGDVNLITIQGTSDVAKSQTNYRAVLTQLQPTSIIAHVRHIDLETLLFMSGQKRYAQAKIDVDVNFKDITPHQYDGTVLLTTKKGKFNTKILQNDFGVLIPPTAFTMRLDAALQGDDVRYTYRFDSNLARLASQGTLTIEPLKLDVAYDVSMKELALLKPMTGADVRGKLNVKGSVRGTQARTQVRIRSDVADSLTRIDAVLEDFKPKTLSATIDKMKIEKLLYMLKQPHYTDGTIRLKADLKDLRSGNLLGEVTTRIEGKLDAPFLTREFSFAHPMPSTRFTLASKSFLKKDTVTTDMSLNSDLVAVQLQKAVFSLANGSLQSTYSCNIPSLDRFYFVSDKHLRGGIQIDGKIEKAKDVRIEAHSKIAQGLLDMTLVNDNVHLDLQNMRTKKVLWILRYPEIFDGGVYAKVDYNLQTSRGDITARFAKGVFLKNKAFDLMRRYGKINLYRERFDGDAKARIEKEKIAAVFDLRSKKARISSEKTVLNTAKNTIKSNVVVEVKQTPITVTLRGDVMRPKVGVDLQAFMKTKTAKKLEKKAKKEVEKLLKKWF